MIGTEMLFDRPEVVPERLGDQTCTLAAQDDSFFDYYFADPSFAARFSEKFGFAQVPWGMGIARESSPRSRSKSIWCSTNPSSSGTPAKRSIAARASDRSSVSPRLNNSSTNSPTAIPLANIPPLAYKPSTTFRDSSIAPSRSPSRSLRREVGVDRRQHCHGQSLLSAQLADSGELRKPLLAVGAVMDKH